MWTTSTRAGRPDADDASTVEIVIKVLIKISHTYFFNAVTETVFLKTSRIVHRKCQKFFENKSSLYPPTRDGENFDAQWCHMEPYICMPIWFLQCNYLRDVFSILRFTVSSLSF